jgi:Protein of unknown function (DUF3102)
MGLDQGLPARKPDRRSVTAPNLDTIKVGDEKSTAKKTPMEEVAEAEKTGDVPAFLRRETTPASREFGYDALDPTLATELRGKGVKIRDQSEVTCTAIIETGHDLIAVKRVLPHGQFLAWVEAECGFSHSTAANYMNAAKLADKFPTVGNLPLPTLYRLAAKASPTGVVADVVRRVEAGKVVNDGDVKQMIAGLRGEQSRASRQGRRQKKVSEHTLRRQEAKARKHEEETRLRIETEKARAAEIIARLGAERAQFLLAVYRDPEIYYGGVFAHLADLLNAHGSAP